MTSILPGSLIAHVSLPLDAARDGSRGGEPVEPRHRMAPTEAAVRPFDPLRVPSQVEGQAHGHEPVEWHEMLWFESLTTLSPVDGPRHGPTSVTWYLFFAPVIKATEKELATMKSG